MKFCYKIQAYYTENKRNLPWRKTKEPYKIWLSEIIMQQTQISQGTAYYLKFIETFPTIFNLAKASEQAVLLLWQGLGYYSRARNLHHTAKEIATKHQGKFPETYKELIKLKGIGDYTASAILSICFNKPYPAVDGNVLRVISRIFNIHEAINQNVGRKIITEKCNSLICNNNPGDFNQALMDFGSEQCKPSNPNCSNCIFNDECIAFQVNTVHELPVKIKAKAKTKEYYNYFLIVFENEIFIQKREIGIWKNLYEFPIIVSKKNLSQKSISDSFKNEFSINGEIRFQKISAAYKHILSHKILYVNFYSVTLTQNQFLKMKKAGFKAINLNSVEDYPFPQIIRKFISNHPV